MVAQCRPLVVAVLDTLGIDKAHIVGLSMGGFCTVHFGLQTPERALSLTVAGAGYGCEKEFEEYFRGVSLEVADNFEKQGAREFARIYALGANRVRFQNKDPVAGESLQTASPPIPIAAPPTPCAASGPPALLLRPRRRPEEDDGADAGRRQ